MSVLALPLTPPDITNAHHYIFKQEDANHDEDPTKALGAFESEDWSRFGLSSGLIGPTPPTLRIYSGHAQSRTSDVSGSGRVEPYGYERYESYGSEFLKPDEVSMPEEVREPIQLKLKVEGGIEADVHDFMTKVMPDGDTEIHKLTRYSTHVRTTPRLHLLRLRCPSSITPKVSTAWGLA